MKLYSEYDPVQLKTQYARSKFLGEQAAVDGCQKTFIIRPGWLFGGTPEHRRNFVYQRYLEALREPVLRSAADNPVKPPPTIATSVARFIDRGFEGGASSAVVSQREIGSTDISFASDYPQG